MENPLFDGAMQGMQLFDAFQNIGRSNEIYKRQMLRQRALDSILESNAQMQMLQNARPVDESGKVSYDLNNPAQMRGVSGFMPQVNVERDVNPARKASLVGFDGKPKGDFELMTPEELNGRSARFKRQDLVQELMMKLNLAEGQQQARSRGQMNVLDYKDSLEKRNQAAEPRVNPNNLNDLPPDLPLSLLGPLANFINATKPHMSQTTNRETGDVIFTGVDRTGKAVTVNDPAWKGAAAPRKRQAPGSGKTDAGGKNPLTVTQTAASAVERVLAENQGGNIDDAIRNAEKFYQDDPEMARPGVRALVVSKLKAMKRSPKSKPNAEGQQPAQAPAAKADLVYDMATGQFKKGQ